MRVYVGKKNQCDVGNEMIRKKEDWTNLDTTSNSAIIFRIACRNELRRWNGCKVSFLIFIIVFHFYTLNLNFYLILKIIFIFYLSQIGNGRSSTAAKALPTQLKLKFHHQIWKFQSKHKANAVTKIHESQLLGRDNSMYAFCLLLHFTLHFNHENSWDNSRLWPQ